MVEKASGRLFTEGEIAQFASDTVAQTQRLLAELENAQRERGTPFTLKEIAEYERLCELGVKQVRDVNHLL